jgi:hypothetical protein
LIMYANDLAGNIGVSKVVVFTVKSENDNSSQLWVVGVIGIIDGLGIILSLYIGSDLLRVAIKKPRQNNSPIKHTTFLSNLVYIFNNTHKI